MIFNPLFVCLLVLWGLLGSSAAFAKVASALPDPQVNIGVDENLGQSLPLDASFVNEKGETVRLSSIFVDDKPTLVTLNYYKCETLCSVQLNAVLNGLKDLKEVGWEPGDEFRILTVSIDAREKSPLAAEKAANYKKALGLVDAEWHFWVGEQPSIDALSQALGFQYVYDATTDQFAHPSVIAFTDPKGAISRYLYGIQYPGRDIKFALMESAAGRAGSPVDKLILSCFSYDSTLGKYTPAAFGIMRLGGLISLLSLGLFSLIMWRGEFRLSRLGSHT